MLLPRSHGRRLVRSATRTAVTAGLGLGPGLHSRGVLVNLEKVRHPLLARISSFLAVAASPDWGHSLRREHLLRSN